MTWMYLRHGGMGRVFGGIRAPSTLGSFLRCLAWGNVRQLEKASRELLARPAVHTPLLPGADQLAFVDVDSMQRRVYSAAKQGAAASPSRRYSPTDSIAVTSGT
jgi:hypothetical protein